MKQNQNFGLWLKGFGWLKTVGLRIIGTRAQILDTLTWMRTYGVRGFPTAPDPNDAPWVIRRIGS
jgi:hypothetical protein